MKISDAELKVMQVIWNKKKVTSAEIIKELEECKWSDNTIRTLITRLVTKKAVEIGKKTGKTYEYIPLIDEKRYKAEIFQKNLNCLFNGSISECLIILAESNRKYAQDIIKVLKKLVEEDELRE